jgi:hypothetical protein
MNVDTIAKGIVTFCDIANFINSLQQAYHTPDDIQDVRIASIVNRLAILGLKAGESIALLKGAKVENLRNIKSAEFFCRTLDLPIRMVEVSHSETDDYRFFEKGVVAPLSDIVRVIAEKIIYDECCHLQKYEEEGESAMRPVYELGSDGELQQTGCRPIDPKECRETIESNKQIADISTTIRIISESEMTSKTIRTSHTLYEQLAYWLGSQPPLQPAGPAINLLALQEIPEALEQDIVFRRYICAITHSPIRDPVGDPNGHALYERRAIMEWLNRGHYTSPVTNQPLRPDQLVEKPVLKVLIEDRLHYHEQRLWEYIQTSRRLQRHLNAPVNAALQAAADRENPHT